MNCKTDKKLLQSESVSGFYKVLTKHCHKMCQILNVAIILMFTMFNESKW